MTYSVYQHWDPLKVCIVGRSYSPEFYSFIKNDKVRVVMEKIARETEEDYQKLIALLESFGVKVLRPNVSNNYQDHVVNGKIKPPPMTPRDYSIMLGKDFYFKAEDFFGIIKSEWNNWRGADWPDVPASINELHKLSPFIKTELEEWFLKMPIDNVFKKRNFNVNFYSDLDRFIWGSILDHVACNSDIVNLTIPELKYFNSANTTRLGKDIYVGTEYYTEDKTNDIITLSELYPNYRWRSVDTGGHNDGTFCPVCPGLIISLEDIPTYANTFPGWEVIYLPGQSWDKVDSFLKLKEKNGGKWWVPGEELNNEFTEFVESWLNHWVGYVEETVFDVNMLVIDRHNVICNNYNKDVFDAFERYSITPHVVNFRHRYFWDGGLHCITSDLHREGAMQDYFPDRTS